VRSDDAKLGSPRDREHAYVTLLIELGLELRVDGELTTPLPTSALASLPEEADPSPGEGRVMTHKVEYSLCAGVFERFGPSLGSRIGSDGVDLCGSPESQSSPIG
jgi:hypothetical protein